MSAAAFVFLVFACLGGGGILLRLFRLDRVASPAERLIWAFTLGFGLLGWLSNLIALAGWARPAAFLVLGMAMAGGLPLVLRRPWPVPVPPLTLAGRLTVAAALLIAGVDLLEALCPMSDADTLAYHYALIKEVLARGRMVFEPRAMDGATPLVIQMTYAAAMALGGEPAANLWLMGTGWALGLLCWAMAARLMPPLWAGAVALSIQSLPAVLVGAGTGQIEVRLALLATLGMIAAARVLSDRHGGFALTAAFVAGLLGAAKFTGLLQGGAVGVVLATILLARRRFGLLAACILLAAVVASPYYVWSWVNTGDPVFPLLWGKLPYLPGAPWNEAQNIFLYRTLQESEMAVPKSLFWLLAYPFAATFLELPALDSVRAGFGPWLIMMLPMALPALKRVRGVPWAGLAAVVLASGILFYVAWFVLGGSQRVRHFLPVLPAVLVVTTALARGWAAEHGVERLAAWSLAVLLLFQTVTQTIMARNYAVNLVTGESREDYLDRVVGYGRALAWLNTHVGQEGRVLHPVRQLNYLLDVPYLFSNPAFEARVEARPDNGDPMLFQRQIKAQGISHLMVYAQPDTGEFVDLAYSGLPELARRLVALGCARVEARIDALSPPVSRTLARRDRETLNFAMIRVDFAPPCPAD